MKGKWKTAFALAGLRPRDFIDRQHKAKKPFFRWWNATRMHFRTHVRQANLGISGQGFYNDGMVEHDRHVGELLKQLDNPGIADNTIVIYSTNNGPHYNAWPDAAIMPFRSEKNTIKGDTQLDRRPQGLAADLAGGGRGRHQKHRDQNRSPSPALAKNRAD